jgi:hypothetical protein
MESWRIHITPAGSHVDSDARLYDPRAKYGAIRGDEGFEVEFSANSLRDLASARVQYEMLRLALPPEVLAGVVGEIVIMLPNGNTWTGKLGDFLEALNHTFTDYLKPMVSRVEELEKLGKAMPDDAIGEIAMILKARPNSAISDTKKMNKQQFIAELKNSIDSAKNVLQTEQLTEHEREQLQKYVTTQIDAIAELEGQSR